MAEVEKRNARRMVSVNRNIRGDALTVGYPTYELPNFKLPVDRISTVGPALPLYSLDRWNKKASQVQRALLRGNWPQPPQSSSAGIALDTAMEFA